MPKEEPTYLQRPHPSRDLVSLVAERQSEDRVEFVGERLARGMSEHG